MNYTQAIAVGGPLAGKLIPISDECKHLEVFQWAAPKRVSMRLLLELEDLRSIPYDLHTYRWKEVVVRSGYFDCRCVAMVHESFKDTLDINRAVVGFVIAQMFAGGIK